MPQPGSYNGDYSSAPEPARRDNEVKTYEPDAGYIGRSDQAKLKDNKTPEGYDPNFDETAAKKRVNKANAQGKGG